MPSVWGRRRKRATSQIPQVLGTTGLPQAHPTLGLLSSEVHGTRMGVFTNPEAARAGSRGMMGWGNRISAPLSLTFPPPGASQRGLWKAPWPSPLHLQACPGLPPAPEGRKPSPPATRVWRCPPITPPPISAPLGAQRADPRAVPARATKADTRSHPSSLPGTGHEAPRGAPPTPGPAKEAGGFPPGQGGVRPLRVPSRALTHSGLSFPAVQRGRGPGVNDPRAYLPGGARPDPDRAPSRRAGSRDLEPTSYGEGT
nr:basic proline-rich protein-like [Marmota flaviventris]